MDNNRKLTFFIAFFLFTGYSFAQVNGRVTDQNGNVLPFVNVALVKSADSSLVQGVVTNDLGEFSIIAKDTGSFRILANFIGYTDSYSIPFVLTEANKKYAADTIKLAESITTLGSVEITVKKQILERRPDGIVVNVENTILAQGNNLLELLKRMPGVSIDNDGNISLRGKSGVLVFIDNRPSYVSGKDLVTLLKSINANQVSKVDLITNPSSKYDAAGNAGIINIQLKKSKLLGLNCKINSGYGQSFTKSISDYVPSVNEGISANYRTMKWNFFGSYNYGFDKYVNYFEATRKYSANGIPESIFKQEQVSKIDDQTHFGKVAVDYIGDKHELGFFAYGNTDNSSYSDNYSHVQLLNAEGRQNMIVDSYNSGKGDFASITANLNYKFKIDTTGSEFRFNVDYSNMANNTYDEYYSEYFDSISQPLNTRYLLQSSLPSIIDIKSAKVDYTKPAGKYATFDLGLKTSFISTDNDAQYKIDTSGYYVVDTGKTNHFLYTENINAGYLNFSYKPEGKFNFQLGLRVEHTVAKGNQLINDQSFRREYIDYFPSAFFSWQVNEKNQLSLNYSRRIDRPGYDWVNPFIWYADPYTSTRGNPSLKPQYTNNMELGYTFSEWLTASIGYSRTDNVITNTIIQDNATQSLYFTYLNFKTFDKYYASIITSFHLTKWLTTTNTINGYYNSYNTELSGGNFNPKIFTIALNSLTTAELKKGWGAELSFYYISKDLSNSFILHQRGNMTVGISKKIAKEKGNLSISFSDILWTERYKVEMRYQDTDYNSLFYSASRKVYLTLTWALGRSQMQFEEKESGAEDEINRANK